MFGTRAVACDCSHLRRRHLKTVRGLGDIVLQRVNGCVFVGPNAKAVRNDLTTGTAKDVYVCVFVYFSF